MAVIKNLRDGDVTLYMPFMRNEKKYLRKARLGEWNIDVESEEWVDGKVRRTYTITGVELEYTDTEVSETHT